VSGGKRGRLTRATQATRSALRRYPGTLLDSIRRRDPGLATPGARTGLSAPPEGLCAVWLGHASVLVGLDGRFVLFDPVFSERIGPRVGKRKLGLARTSPPPVHADDLPPIDVLAISHAHFDHLDLPTLEALASERTAVVTAARTHRLIPSGYGRTLELQWDESFEVAGLLFTAIRPQHWGARRVLDRRRGYNAYLVDSGRHRVLFAGDTGDTLAFDQLRNIDLAVLGIGAYEPWEHAHATPEQVWSMFRRMGARSLAPVHHSTFPMSDEAEDEPMRRLHRAAGDEFESCVVCRQAGEVWVEGNGQ